MNNRKQAGQKGKYVLEVRNLTKRFGNLVAVNNVSLELEEDKITGLIGPNGAGKTTLFNLVTRQLRSDGGKVFFQGEDITNLRAYQIARRGIGRTWQVIRIFAEMTVMENLMTAAHLIKKGDAAERAFELLKLVGLADKKDSYAGELSIGEQKMVELIRILMFGASVMLLDEPVAGINPSERLALLDLIHNLCETEGKTFCVVEHDMDMIMGHCDRVICLNFGEKIAEGTPEQVQNNERVIQAYFGA